MEITIKHINIVRKKFNEIDGLDNFIENSKYSKTLRLFKNNISKIEALKTDLDLIKSHYTSSCILRVIIEIHIINVYIFNNLPNLKSDTIGEIYYREYFLSEHLKRENYNLGVEGILKGNKKNANFENLKERIKDNFPEFNQEYLQDLRTKANKFDIKKIQQEIIDNPIFGIADEFQKKLIPELLKAYNNLSSYVHSGPNAEKSFLLNPSDTSEGKQWSAIFLFFSYTSFFILVNLENNDYPELIEYVDLKNKHFC